MIQKAYISGGKLKNHLGGVDFGEITNANEIASLIGYNALYANLTANHKQLSNVARADESDITSTDVATLRTGNIIRIRYENINLEGDKLFQKKGAYNSENSYTVFRCQLPGAYQVNAMQMIDFTFDDKIDTEGEKLLSTLSIIKKRRNDKDDKPLRQIAESDGMVIDQRPITGDPTIIYYDTRFFLHGSDIFYLKAGDEISVQLYVDVTPFAAVNVTDIKQKGYFSVGFLGETQLTIEANNTEY